MQQCADIYLLESHSMCFGCHSTQHWFMMQGTMSLTLFMSLKQITFCLLFPVAHLSKLNIIT